MKILLVQTPVYSNVLPHLGFAYLTSTLNKHGHVVIQEDLNSRLNGTKDYKKLIKYNDIKSYSLDNLPKDIENICNNLSNLLIQYKPEIIGFSLIYSTTKISLIIAKKVKEQNPGIKIVVGGQATFDKILYNRIKSCNFIDYIIKGEGENKFIELLKKIKNTNENLSVSNLSIDSLPFPEFNLNQKWKYSHMLPMMLTRGCIGKCTYCSERLFWGKYKKRSIKNIIDEFKNNIEKYNINYYWFFDSLINGDMNFFQELCDEILKQDINVYWGGYIRIHPKIIESFADKLYKAGCRFLRIGIESGSQPVLNHMNKGISIKNAADVIKNIHKSNMYTHLCLIVGYPTEKNANYLETFNFLLNNYNNINSFYVHLFEYSKNLLEKDNPLHEIKKHSLKSKLIRRYILNLLTKSNTKNYFYDTFLNFKDVSNYTNKETEKKYFKKPLIIDNFYYLDEKKIEINNQINNFVSDEILSKNNFKQKLPKVLDIDKKIKITKPFPPCIVKDVKELKKINPKNCEECGQFIDIKNNEIFLCKKIKNKTLKNKELKTTNPENYCKDCIYLKRIQCYPCYFQKDYWYKV